MIFIIKLNCNSYFVNGSPQIKQYFLCNMSWPYMTPNHYSFYIFKSYENLIRKYMIVLRNKNRFINLPFILYLIHPGLHEKMKCFIRFIIYEVK